MTNCKNCAAPLIANTNICEYCGTRNDVDLQDKQFHKINQASGKNCPCCDIPLQTMSLEMNRQFYIERCPDCFGLFFEPDELETLLECSISHVHSVNFQLLDNINQERYQRETHIQYVKCPVCHILMNRVNFAYRSGVVVDRCRDHGTWLKCGELIHLLEWKKAGGQQRNPSEIW
jgi:Zn-finger nucleic acid-binding protein